MEHRYETDVPYRRILKATSLCDVSYMLGGVIPHDLGHLLALKYLNLAHNQLESPIPLTLRELKANEVVDLSDDRLTGSIPATLARLNFLSSFKVATVRSYPSCWAVSNVQCLGLRAR